MHLGVFGAIKELKSANKKAHSQVTKTIITCRRGDNLTGEMVSIPDVLIRNKTF